MYFPPTLLTTTLIIATLSILTLPTTVALTETLNHTSLSPIHEHEGLIKRPRPYSTQPPPPTNKPSTMTHLSKRARRMGDLPPEFRTFALEHGWSITVASISVVVPLASDLGVRNVRATRLLGTLFGEVQAKCAAHMLNNSPFGAQRVAFRFGKTELLFE
ncbi:MAG: hypothetical protein LQ344_007694, partial [Seirophora lacunosa]